MSIGDMVVNPGRDDSLDCARRRVRTVRDSETVPAQRSSRPGEGGSWETPATQTAHGSGNRLGDRRRRGIGSHL